MAKTQLTGKNIKDASVGVVDLDGTFGNAVSKSTGTTNNDIAAGDTPSPAFTTLTDGATITWACGARVSHAVVTIAGNRTLSMTGLVAGNSGTLIVKQDVTGGRTLTLPGTSRVVGGAGGGAALTAATLAVDILAWIYDGSVIYWTVGRNYT